MGFRFQIQDQVHPAVLARKEKRAFSALRFSPTVLAHRGSGLRCTTLQSLPSNLHVEFQIRLTS